MSTSAQQEAPTGFDPTAGRPAAEPPTPIDLADQMPQVSGSGARRGLTLTGLSLAALATAGCATTIFGRPIPIDGGGSPSTPGIPDPTPKPTPREAPTPDSNVPSKPNVYSLTDDQRVALWDNPANHEPAPAVPVQDKAHGESDSAYAARLTKYYHDYAGRIEIAELTSDLSPVSTSSNNFETNRPFTNAIYVNMAVSGNVLGINTDRSTITLGFTKTDANGNIIGYYSIEGIVGYGGISIVTPNYWTGDRSVAPIGMNTSDVLSRIKLGDVVTVNATIYDGQVPEEGNPAYKAQLESDEFGKWLRGDAGSSEPPFVNRQGVSEIHFTQMTDNTNSLTA